MTNLIGFYTDECAGGYDLVLAIARYSAGLARGRFGLNGGTFHCDAAEFHSHIGEFSGLLRGQEVHGSELAIVPEEILDLIVGGFTSSVADMDIICGGSTAGAGELNVFGHETDTNCASDGGVDGIGDVFHGGCAYGEVCSRGWSHGSTGDESGFTGATAGGCTCFAGVADLHVFDDATLAESDVFLAEIVELRGGKKIDVFEHGARFLDDIHTELICESAASEVNHERFGEHNLDAIAVHYCILGGAWVGRQETRLDRHHLVSYSLRAGVGEPGLHVASGCSGSLGVTSDFGPEFIDTSDADIGSLFIDLAGIPASMNTHPIFLEFSLGESGVIEFVHPSFVCVGDLVLVSVFGGGDTITYAIDGAIGEEGAPLGAGGLDEDIAETFVAHFLTGSHDPARIIFEEFLGFGFSSGEITNTFVVIRVFRLFLAINGDSFSRGKAVAAAGAFDVHRIDYFLTFILLLDAGTFFGIDGEILFASIENRATEFIAIHVCIGAATVSTCRFIAPG
ncbi:unannotated protein [freshwater metagenome]|uniref:Unannotated protein n=1 Tax=freshwater metagenome TaxID=449393 RepID=A0A6J6EMB5_9ZZZZ